MHFINFYGILFINVALAAPFCSIFGIATTKVVWKNVQVHRTITVGSQTTLAPTASFISTSKSTYDVTTRTSSALYTSKHFGGSNTFPVGEFLCSKSEPCTGDLTYFDTATDPSSPGACGTTNDGEVDFVLALPHGIMKSSDCGKTVRIDYGGEEKVGKVVDKCMGCSDQSIDLSRALFQEYSGLKSGRLSGTNWYIEK